MHACRFLRGRLGLDFRTFLPCGKHLSNPLRDFSCTSMKTDRCFGAMNFETLQFFKIFFILYTPWTQRQVVFPHLLLMKTHGCSSRSSSIPLRTRRWHWRWHVKSIETEATVSAPHILSFLLHIPNIRHVWLFFKDIRHGCHLCASHICSLLLVFSVLSTPGLCGKCCVPLFCFCGGFVSLCLKDTSNSGQRDAWCLGRDRNGYFLLSLAVIDFGHCFLFSPVFMENIIRQKKDGRHRTRVSAVLLEKCIIFWKEICCFISKTKHELVWNYSAQFRWSKQLGATLHVSTDSFSLPLGGKSEGPLMHRRSALEQRTCRFLSRRCSYF